MSQISEFSDKVLSRFADSITDYVFLTIQDDRELMLEYLRLVSDTKLDTVNQQIGKKVKERFGLQKRNRSDRTLRKARSSSRTRFSFSDSSAAQFELQSDGAPPLRRRSLK